MIDPGDRVPPQRLFRTLYAGEATHTGLEFNVNLL